MTHPSTDRWYASVGHGITDQDPDGLLLAWMDGPGSLLGDVDDIVRDSDTHLGWAGQLDPDTTTLPAWLGQFVGATIPDGTPDAEARALVRDRPAVRRGSPTALSSAARRHLTGAKTVLLRERDGSAYRLTVTTYTGETPDAAVVEAALRAAKPAGLVLTYQVVDATSYTAAEAMTALTYTELEAQPVLTYTDQEAGL